MSTYKFRLRSVEIVRAARRDQARAALAEAFQAECVLSEKQARIAAEQADLLARQRAVAADQYFDIGRLADAQQYGIVLRAQHQENARQEALLQVEIERRRRTLVEAEREVRVMEMLDERQRKAHAREVRRQEMKQLDEIAMRTNSRRKRSES